MGDFTKVISSPAPSWASELTTKTHPQFISTLSTILGDLPSDYTANKGFESFVEALSGRNGPSQKKIAEMTLQLGALLLQKNASYGDSALKPLSVFAKDLTPAQRMSVRMDDKVNRLANGLNDADGEDAAADLAGYLILLLIAKSEE